MKKKTLTVVVAFALLFGWTLGVSSAPIMENISAKLDWSIKFKLDGKDWTPEGGGNKLAPINYNNTNYLPVRAVAEAVGVAIEWDGANRVIHLGEKTTEIPITSEGVELGSKSRMMETKDKQYTVQDGVDYESGIVVNEINSADKVVTLQPNGKYQTLTFDFHGLNLDKDVNIHIMDGNTVLKEINLTSAQSHYSVSQDIGGLSEVKIALKSSPGAKESLFFAGTYK